MGLSLRNMKRIALLLSLLLIQNAHAGTDDYRLGDEWGKTPITAEDLDRADAVTRKLALSTAKVSGATGFYLGKYDGRHLMATNYHVISAAWGCLGNPVRFPLLGSEAICKTFFGAWSDIDLALFEIDVKDAALERSLSSLGGGFAFDLDLRPGQPLAVAGYGGAGNPGRALTIGADDDCKVFSGENEFRHLADPDEFNPATYKAWSFATGCDSSHGDSGSPVIDRATGAFVGILWTGRTPKSAGAQSSSVLDEWLAIGSEEIWTELTYMVPARKIREHLETVIAKPSTKPETKTVLSALIAN